jgi:catechol 2,3-dioxygenase-like lactoylglutathione lyase family enzyme
VIRGFSHLQLVVRDVDVSAAWYRTVLGLDELTRGVIDSGPFVALRHPTAHFVIGMQTATPAQLPLLGGSSVDHLSFAVTDRRALDETREALRVAGIEVGELFEEAVSVNVRLRDPDGTVIELTAPKAG